MCSRMWEAQRPSAALVLILLVLAVAVCAAASERIEITAEDVTRAAWVHVPETLEEGVSVPLVLAFHGSTWNGRMMEDVTGLDAIADRERFIVVYPDGTGPGDILSWNAGYCCSHALDQGVDDLTFVRALLDFLTDNYPIDSNRVYATGFSNGGMFTYALAIAFPDRFAAVAPVAGAMYPGQALPGIPVPILIIHGTSDAVVPYDGGWGALGPLSGRTIPMLSVRDAVDLWKSNNGCTQDSPVITRERDARIETYADCDGLSEVTLISVVDGRHEWPTVSANTSDFLLTDDAAGFLTAPSDDLTDTVDWALFESGIEASEVIWEFFSQHARS